MPAVLGQPRLEALRKKERVRAVLRLAQHHSLPGRRSNSLLSGRCLAVLGSDLRQGEGQWSSAREAQRLRSNI